jgi:hypothetical protein
LTVAKRLLSDSVRGDRRVDQVFEDFRRAEFGMSIAAIGPMTHGASELVVDFLVPARLASRYRARLTALSPLDAEIAFAFPPSIFRSGVLVSCPARICFVRGREVVSTRGILWIDKGSNRATGRLQFEKPMMFRELDVLRQAFALEPPPLALPEPMLEPAACAASR